MLKLRAQKVLSVLRCLRSRDTWMSLERCDVLLLCHDVDRSLQIQNKYVSPLIESVAHELRANGFETSSLAIPWSMLVNHDSDDVVSLCNRSYFRSRLSKKLKEFSSRLGFRNVTNDNASEERLWSQILAKTSPRVIVSIGAPPNMCVSARKLGIPFVELMHGSRFNRLPWGYGERSPHNLPSHILCFDEVSQTTFQVLESRGVVVSLCEHPQLSLSQAIPNEFDPTEHHLPTKTLRILVALQWGYSRGEEFGDHFSNEMFPTQLLEYLDSENSLLKFVFRLHPVQIRSGRYRRTVKAVIDLCETCRNVEPFPVGHGDLPQLLQQIDCVLTPGSGLASEAVMYSVPVIFFDLNPAVSSDLKVAYAPEIALGVVRFWDPRECELEELVNGAVTISSSWGLKSYESSAKSNPIAADVVLGLLS